MPRGAGSAAGRSAVSPAAAAFPSRVFEALSQALDRPAEELRALMEQLIVEWKQQAAVVMYKHGHEVPDGWQKD